MAGDSVIVRGDALSLPLADDSVDLVVTSPPYFGLRSYTDGGEHYDGQIGSERDLGEFLDVLTRVTEECVRVLKPSGSLWVNLGDSYSTNRGSRNVGMNTRMGRPTGTDVQARSTQQAPRVEGFRPKTLMGVPWRYALRCIDDLGLLLRAEVIWEKPNGLPESVADRVRRSHEQWFHFTLSQRYYSAVDEIREPHLTVTRARPLARGRNASSRHVAASDNTGWKERPLEELGRLPGSVWSVPVEPLYVPPELGIEHFAAFPSEWPRRIILGWSPPAVCLGCGEGRRPITAVSIDSTGRTNSGRAKRQRNDQLGHDRGFNAAGYPHAIRSASIVGYVCACTPKTSNVGQRGDWREGREESEEHLNGFGQGSGNAVPRRPGGFGTKVLPPEVAAVTYDLGEWQPPATSPAVVLDPFSGTGTVAMVAKALGRVGVGVDLSHDYCRLGQWRTADLAQLAKVRREAFRKPEPQADGQEALWS